MDSIRRVLVGRMRRLLNSLSHGYATQGMAAVLTKKYWTRHNVTLHESFAGPEESLEYLQWRNDQYHNYIDLMPVSGFDSRVVLDFGCGPGHDLVGFGVHSRPTRLIGMDVSRSSLRESRARLALHRIEADLIELAADDTAIPLPDGSVDHVHSSGVLHHTSDPVALLRELRRVLRDGGTMNIMVYNYDSLWMHLYVAYQWQVLERRYSKLDMRSAFGRSTDGEDCPISNVYTPDEFIALCAHAGLEAAFSGAAVSIFETSLLPLRYRAIMDRRLNAESRHFLTELEFDNRGFPMWRAHYAGVDGCYRLCKG